jgi:hypothetical protein
MERAHFIVQPSRRRLALAVLLALLASLLVVAAVSAAHPRQLSIPSTSHRGCIDPNGNDATVCQPVAAGVQIDPEGLSSGGLVHLLAAGAQWTPMAEVGSFISSRLASAWTLMVARARSPRAGGWTPTATRSDFHFDTCPTCRCMSLGMNGRIPAHLGTRHALCVARHLR